jgi:hypothetical protein
MKKINIACIIDDDPIIFVLENKTTNFCVFIMVFENGKDVMMFKAIIVAKEPQPDIILLI